MCWESSKQSRGTGSSFVLLGKLRAVCMHGSGLSVLALELKM